MRCLIEIVRLTLLVAVSRAEWVEISQQPKPGDDLIRSTSSIRLVKTHEVSTQYRDVTTTTLAVTTTPSPHWVQYQRERYGNRSTQGLIVSTGQHLKNTAQIVVPASVIVSTVATTSTALAKNKYFHTKTRLNVGPQRDRKKSQNNRVETTSKREMSEHQHNDDEADDVVEEVEDANADDEAEDGEEQPQPTMASTDVQMPSIKGFFKFLKSIQSAWWRKTGLSLESKILMLKKLRDNLMQAIEKQLSIIWLPEKSEERRLRRRRGLLDESNLNFPPEAALMSINFLTFAVFLIKLVLQVVHIVKSKHYSFSGFNVNTEPVRKMN